MDKFMELAFRQAKMSDPFPNPRVGAVLVKGNRILGAGYHRAPGMPHAEIEAIQSAKQKTGDPKAAHNATLYVTLEPCSHTNKRTPPCTDAIISHGIRRVVYAMDDPNPLVSGSKALREAGVEVKGPTDPKKAASINKKYIRNISEKPLVVIKMAMSADGKTATRTGDSKWITGKEAREHVHRMRSRFDAVMVGAETVRIDNPGLTARLPGARNPYRIIVDGKLSIPSNSKVLEYEDGKTIIATTSKAPKERVEKMENVLVCGEGEVDMRRLLFGLNAMGMKKILIEGGSELNSKALEAGIVDKLYIFIAPKIIGGKDAKGVIGGEGIDKMIKAKKLKNMKTKKIGEDLLLEFDL